LAWRISHCFSANHDQELRCVIFTVLHFLHWCYTFCTDILELYCSQPIRIEYFFSWILLELLVFWHFFFDTCCIKQVQLNLIIYSTFQLNISPITFKKIHPKIASNRLNWTKKKRKYPYPVNTKCKLISRVRFELKNIMVSWPFLLAFNYQPNFVYKLNQYACSGGSQPHNVFFQTWKDDLL